MIQISPKQLAIHNIWFTMGGFPVGFDVASKDGEI